MSRLRSSVISTSLLALGIYASYRFLLNDDARESLRISINSVRKNVLTLIEKIDEVEGVVLEDDGLLEAHRCAIADKWQRLESC
ncbi:hypothetical protein ACQQ9Y_06680 [Atopobiaceae bacterium SGI.236]|nr:hypothetical protein [Atopobiaceae bacterium]